MLETMGFRTRGLEDASDTRMEVKITGKWGPAQRCWTHWRLPKGRTQHTGPWGSGHNKWGTLREASGIRGQGHGLDMSPLTIS